MTGKLICMIFLTTLVAITLCQSRSRHSRNRQSTEPDRDDLKLKALSDAAYTQMGSRSRSNRKYLTQGNPYARRIRCTRRSRFRNIDGTCNNLRDPFQGAAKTPLPRLVPENTYEDGFNAPTATHFVTGTTLPPARQVSLAVHMTDIVLSDRHSHLLMNFGQFTDHDLSLSPEAEVESEAEREVCCEPESSISQDLECFPLSSENDPIFERDCIPFLRSSPAPGRTDAPLIRFQINDLTSYIDASQVYGSTKSLTRSLVNSKNGDLETSVSENNDVRLPLDEETCGDAVTPTNPEECTFRAGDIRNSEQAALTSVHTLLVREHNRIAAEIRRLNPRASAGLVFQITRKIVGAIMQRITYREFLPEVLGPVIMKKFGLTLLDEGRFKSYSERIDASVLSEFSTGAFRFGHSLVRQTFAVSTSDRVDLRDMFNAFETTDAFGSDGILGGLAGDTMFDRDRFITAGLRDRLFGEELDLPAFNIQRGRDHGLASYNDVRKRLRLRVLSEFSQLIGRTHDQSSVEALQQVYPETGDLELFPAGLSEKPLPGAIVGETFGAIIGLQFKKARFGDRFWHETDDRYTKFTDAQLAEIRKVSLAGLFCENVEGSPVREWMLLIESNSNPIVDCSTIPQMDFDAWKH